MKISIEHLQETQHLRAANEAGLTIDMDTGMELGGDGYGPRPMQLVLMALGGCTSIDVLSILQKQRQAVEAYRIEVDGQRAEGQIPKVFTAIHLLYDLTGDLDPAKVQRAIDLSLEKYCSVTRMLESTVSITYTYRVNGTTYSPS